jgi:hypothetical protein
MTAAKMAGWMGLVVLLGTGHGREGCQVAVVGMLQLGLRPGVVYVVANATRLGSLI